MKRQDFTRYLVLHEQLDKARNCLLDLQEAAVPGAQVLTGMPHAPGVKDKVGNLAIEIADTKASIRDMEEEMEVSIVSTVEADFLSGKISNQSLLGQSLIGKKAGDEVEVKAPAGTSKFRILKIGK